MAPRPGQINQMPMNQGQGMHQQPKPGQAPQAGAGRGGMPAVHPGAGPPPGAQGAPIRVRQAFKWAYNLRKKQIDKARIRKPQYTVMLPSGLDVHTAMVELDHEMRSYYESMGKEMMMIAFITFKSSLVPLFESL